MSEISLPLLSQPSDCLIPRLKLKLSPARLELLLGALRREKKELTELGLQTIDRLIYDRISPPTAAALETFRTTDAGVARIFSDVIEKGKDVRGKTERPSIRSVFRSQSLFQCRQDRLPPPTDALHLISLRDYPLLSLRGLSVRAAAPIPGSPWLLVQTDVAPAAKERPIKPGHVCSLVTLPDEASAKEYFADLLTQRNVRSLIRKVQAVGPADYLDGILSEGIGCDVDFFALTLATGRSLEELLPSLPTGYLVWTTKRGARRLAPRLSNVGCTLTTFIRAKRRSCMTFYYRHEAIFDCGLASLRSLTAPRTAELQILPASPRCITDTEPLPPAQIGDYLVTYKHLPAECQATPQAVSDWLAKARRMLAQAGGCEEKCYLAFGVCEHPGTPVVGLWSAALSLHEAQSKADLTASELQICPSPSAPGGTTVCLIAPMAR